MEKKIVMDLLADIRNCRGIENIKKLLPDDKLGAKILRVLNELDSTLSNPSQFNLVSQEDYDKLKEDIESLNKIILSHENLLCDREEKAFKVKQQADEMRESKWTDEDMMKFAELYNNAGVYNLDDALDVYKERTGKP